MRYSSDTPWNGGQVAVRPCTSRAQHPLPTYLKRKVQLNAKSKKVFPPTYSCAIDHQEQGRRISTDSLLASSPPCQAIFSAIPQMLHGDCTGDCSGEEETSRDFFPPWTCPWSFVSHFPVPSSETFNGISICIQAFRPQHCTRTNRENC